MEFDFLQPSSISNLLLFLLDGSTSMADRRTPDGRSKADHVKECIGALIERLARSSKAAAYRISFIYFNHDVELYRSVDGPFFTPFEVLEARLPHNPLEYMGGGATSLAGVLRAAAEVLDEFSARDDFPEERYATVFIMSDGRESFVPDDTVLAVAQKLRAHISSPTLATVSFGEDANANLLAAIASEPSDRQLRQLDVAGLMERLRAGFDGHWRLFVEGHVGGAMTRETISVLRRFVEVLSTTVGG